ncbi:hypothetical protein [Pseudofrankia asymbiotica]|uniref:hypothetical protein n=1 Tax=Pseudofrankia asymbiotica TaxID=1834516 RepID=UPI001F51E5E3|nr:hypothetical protein [Pseudofrankia asymbiotica]
MAPTDGRRLLDLDHVVLADGRIYRVLGNLDSRTHFFGYNVYSPEAGGDRSYQGRRYRKNFIEDERLPADVLDTYGLIPIADIVEHHQPVPSALATARHFRPKIWTDLYDELVEAAGAESVGIFGSSMFGLHLAADGTVRKDVDFVVEGLGHVDALRQALPRIRERLGFTTVTPGRQLQQYARYQKVFRNDKNSIMPIIERRWTGLQLADDVVTTIRLREPSYRTALELVTRQPDRRDIVIEGEVIAADGSNLFPRIFTLDTSAGRLDVYILWWKFSTPVRAGDRVTLRGSIVRLRRADAVRLTDFSQHWLHIKT